MLAFAFGGIVACTSAGFIELNGENQEIDPNFYFGTYAGLIFFLLLASIFLNKHLEPEVVLLKRYAEHLKKKEAEKRLALSNQMSAHIDKNTDDVKINSETNPLLTDSLGTSCSKTFSIILKVIRNQEMYLPLLFFFI
jgi:hypothetical protein